MSKKETTSPKEVRNQNYEAKKMNSYENSKRKKDKDLPWWVELLFVQIGLPDKLLIKILKTKKEIREIYRNEKKLILGLILFIFTIGYIQPLINYSKTKLNCQKSFKNYILENKALPNLKISELRMIAVNFCNGGEEIDNVKN